MKSGHFESQTLPARYLWDSQITTKLTAATALLMVTAILGPLLTIVTISGISVSVFRLYAPIYGLLLARYLYTHNRVQPLIMTIPIPVWLLIGLGGYATLSLVFVSGLSRALFELITLLTALFVGTMLCLTADSQAAVKRYLVVIFALVASAQLIAFWEIFTDSHLHTSRLFVKEVLPRHARLGSDAASAWFNNQNNLSYFLAFAVGPLTAYGIVPDRNYPTIARAGCIGLVFLSVVVAWANRSRLALVSMLLTVCLVVCLVVLRRTIDRVEWSQRLKRNVVVGSVFAGFAIILLLVVLPNPFSESTLSLWKRWQLARAGASLFVDSYGVGVGVGNTQAAVASGEIATRQTGELHNWLLYFASAFGIVGVVTFLTTLAITCYELGIRALNSGSALFIGMFAMLLVFPLNALAPSNAVLTHSFWVFLFLAIAVSRLPSAEGDWE
ncbi:hypothetical protein [Haladaptatus caseinilyticus]|uniref:hypothetical protein n=1 Tax=Haladaptatus caseinilyticus TaxID=2993314 RepID=UPI00224B6DA9|nr:hypothetical protein [Haladaptatus caseinilyticus]